MKHVHEKTQGMPGLNTIDDNYDTNSTPPPRRLKFRTGNTGIGIVLGFSSLVFSIARQVSGGDFQVIRYGRVSYREGINRNSPEFPSYLKTILDDHCKGINHYAIWCTIQSKGVEARYLVIPQVPAKHIAKAAYWAYRKEVEFHEDDTVFDYDVIGPATDGDKKGIGILACTAPKNELKKLSDVFAGAGRRLTGITVCSFAFQNLFRTRWAGSPEEDLSTLFIGSDWSRIDIFMNGNLVLSRDIKTGTNSLVEAIREFLKSEIKPGISMEPYLDDDITGDAESTDRIHETENSRSGLADLADMIGNGNGLNIVMLRNQLIHLINEGRQGDVEQIYKVVLPVIDRLIRQIERTFDHFTLKHRSRSVNRLYLSGPLCCFNMLREYLGSQLNIPVEMIHPVYPQVPGNENIPETIAETEMDELVPATGLALSGKSRTLNFINTYRHKAVKKINSQVQKASAILIVLLISGFSGVYLYHHRGMALANNRVLHLRNEIAKASPLYSKSSLLTLADTLNQEKNNIQSEVNRLFIVSVLRDIIERTPEAVRYTEIAYERSRSTEGVPVIHTRGVIASGVNDSRHVLASYGDTLSDSPLIENVTISKQDKLSLSGRTALSFKARIDVYEHN